MRLRMRRLTVLFVAFCLLAAWLPVKAAADSAMAEAALGGSAALMLYEQKSASETETPADAVTPGTAGEDGSPSDEEARQSRLPRTLAMLGIMLVISGDILLTRRREK